MKKTYINILLAIFSGILMFAAFPPFEFSFLAWICLVPLLWLLRSCNMKESFLYSYLAGAVFFSCLLYWLVNVTIPGMIILIFILSCFWGFFGVIARYVIKKSIDILLLPFIWIIIEFARSNVLSGFPWGLLGYSQYKNIALIQIADFTGVYGVSFLIVAFNMAMFAVLTKSKKKITYLMVALLFLIMSTTYGRYKINSQHTEWGTPRISVIQGNIPQEMKWDASYSQSILKKYLALTEEAGESNPNLIVWPETSYPYLIDDRGDMASEIFEEAEKVESPILIGAAYTEGGTYFNSAMFFDPKVKDLQVYKKMHLVPFGEYVPLANKLNFLRDHIDKPIGDFQRGEEYTLFPLRVSSGMHAPGEVITRTISFYKFGVLICFEDIFPYLARNYVKRGANFLVNITNDAWFGKTAAARQHLQASVFRAVENRVPVIRSANTGISGFIDSFGNIVATVNTNGEEVFVEGISTANVDIYSRRSYYTVYGDLFIYFCMFMILLIFFTEIVILKKTR